MYQGDGKINQIFKNYIKRKTGKGKTRNEKIKEEFKYKCL
jgi:hypothetical protein